MTNKDQDKGNFSMGFAVGVLAGVAGFFLTKTDEGKALKENLHKEWGNVRKKLESEGVISDANSEMTEIVSGLRAKIYDFLGEEPPKKKRKVVAKSKRSKSKSAKTKAKSKKIFKGV